MRQLVQIYMLGIVIIINYRISDYICQVVRPVIVETAAGTDQETLPDYCLQ